MLLVASGLAMFIFFVSIYFYVERIGGQDMVSASEVPEVEAIVVLGAKVHPNGQPSGILIDRLDTALELYQQGKSKRFLLSGDNGRVDYDEVNGMKEYLESKGVPPEAIFLDHAGFDTYSTIYRAKEIFQVKKVALVTQEFHLKRALYIAEKMGIEAYGVSADRYIYPKMAYYQLREMAARNKAFWYVQVFRPEPKYLGEAIPIWSDASLTHDK